MPNTPDMNLHVMSRLPGFLRAKFKKDKSQQSYMRPMYTRMDSIISSSIRARHESYWRPMLRRYRSLLTGGSPISTLRVPVSERVLALVSRESRIPIPVLRNPLVRHAPDSDVTKARTLFILLLCRVTNATRADAGRALGMSSSYANRYFGIGNRWLADDAAFAERYKNLTAGTSGFTLSNLIP